MENTSKIKRISGFTETISFFHYRSSSAIVDNSLSTPYENNGNILNMNEAATVPFLLTQEYVYTLDSPIEQDRLINFSEQGNKIVLNLIIGRIKQFSVSTNESFKKMFLENIPCYIECLGIQNASNFLIPALSRIVDEKIELKIQFLKVCRNIVDHFYLKGKIGYCLIANNIVRLVNELYTIQSLKEREMKELLFDNYLKIASCLEKEDLGKFLLTKLLTLSIDNNNNSLYPLIEYENVSLITKLIGNLSHRFSVEHCETFIISNMKMLADNPNPEIREAVCGIIPPVAKAVSLNVLQNKINEELYVKISNDTNERVRKKAVEILPELIKVFQEKCGFDPKYNNEFYIKAFKKFMLENNKEVHIAVMTIFGQFIQLLSIAEIEPVYLHFFANTIDEYYCNLKQNYSIEGKKDLLYPAAFNFPAVLYRYGKESWPKLKKAFISLAIDSNDQIKLTLLASFNEIVTILGKEIAEVELMGIYDSFITNSKPKLSSEAIKRLTKVIGSLSNDVKSKYLKYYSNAIPIDEENKIHFEHALLDTWRQKVKTCEAIDCFFPLFPPIVIYHQILPVMILLCIDDYAIVRQLCASTLAKIILFLLNNIQMKKFSDKLIELINTFAYSKCFYVRQEFCKMSHQLICDQGLYQKVLKDILFKLAYDNVKDVRISLGKLCCYVLKKKTIDTNYLLFDDDFYLLMKILMDDEELSVRNSILMHKHKMNNQKLVEKFNEAKAKNKRRNNGIEEKEIGSGKKEKCYYLFNNEMKIFVDEFQIKIPAFARKRKDTTNNNTQENNYVCVIVKEEEKQANGLKIDDSDGGIKEKGEESEIEVSHNEAQGQIENGANNNEHNQLKNNDVLKIS